MSKYDELKAAAEAAKTRKPEWYSLDGHDWFLPSETMALMALANPAAILELIAESERLRNAIAGLLEWVAPIAGDNQDDEASQRELDSVRVAEAAIREASK